MVRFSFVLGSFLLVFASNARGADQLMIKKKTEILATPEKNGKSLGSANQGDVLPLVSKERKGLYWQTQKGFIFALDAQIKTDEQSENSMAASIQKNQNNQQDSPRIRSTVMGVRGLDDNKNDSSKIGNITPDKEAVQKMENNLKEAIKNEK